MSMAKTRLSNRAQRQLGEAVAPSGSSTPCWRGGEDGCPQGAMRCQAAAVAPLMQTGQGDQCRALLQQLQRCKCDTGGAIGPGVRARGAQVAVGVDLEALQRPRPPGSIAQEPLELIAAVGGHVGVGVQGTPVDAGTAGANYFDERWRQDTVARLTRRIRPSGLGSISNQWQRPRQEKFSRQPAPDVPTAIHCAFRVALWKRRY
jgi:hypothetical protein